MWQRFTERARRVIFHAQEEARHLGENYVSPEHILLGITREEDSAATRVLEAIGVSRHQVRSEIERHIAGGDRATRDLQLTPRAKLVFDLAYAEARLLNNNYIGAEHLLLGLIREGNGLAGRVLNKLGVTLDRAREELAALYIGRAPGQKTEGEQRNMWQRFTERARRVVFYAQEEAARLGEKYVSTEHLLLGITREEDTTAGRILESVGVSLGRVRTEIERQVSRGDGASKDMQLTPRPKRVIDLAYDEARQLNNDYIGTEHLLLGLIHEGDGLAGRVLKKLGVDLERSREAVTTLQETRTVDSGGAARPKQDKTVLLARISSLLKKLFDTDASLEQLPPEELLAVLRGEAKPEPSAAEDRTLRAPVSLPRPGDLGVVHAAEGRATVELARDQKALLALGDAYQARDAHGYRELLGGPGEAASVTLLPVGTTLRVLVPPHETSSGFLSTGAVYVRVLDGDAAGSAGWLLRPAFELAGHDDTPFPPPEGE